SGELAGGLLAAEIDDRHFVEIKLAVDQVAEVLEVEHGTKIGAACSVCPLSPLLRGEGWGEGSIRRLGICGETPSPRPSPPEGGEREESKHQPLRGGGEKEAPRPLTRLPLRGANLAA